MQARKSKVQEKKIKRKNRRIARRYARKAQGKKPLVEPLTIAPTLERNAAAKQGKMVFLDGNKRITLPLMLEHADFGSGSLQGIYKRANGNLVTLRAFPRKLGYRVAFIGFFNLEWNGGERLIRTNWDEPAFVYRQPDLAHLKVKESMVGESLGLKAGSKAEREQRAKARGKHSFFPGTKFSGFFEKLGYRKIDTLASKSGKFNPKDDLSKWHRIEAIDPKNEKARIFTFLVEKKN